MLGLDDDFNYGLSWDWMIVPIEITKVIKQKYSYYDWKAKASFDWVIWLNLNWTLHKVHFEIFKYFRYYLNIARDEEFAKLSDEEAFKLIFEDIEKYESKYFWSSGDDEGKAPYTIQIVNPLKK